MTFRPRPYQQAAHDAVVAEIRRTVDPCLVDAAPAAGKSFLIAMLANTIHGMSGGKKILCLAPSAELVKQNSEKFGLTGEPYSIYSASAGRKDLRHKVVFGTPLTVKNRISRFLNDYGAVIVDECHGITPTIRDIVAAMRGGNPNLRVIGLSGTPYRLGTGYIYRIGPDGTINGEDVARDPYFTKCVIRISPQEMLEGGFITPMDIGHADAGYDTSGLVAERGGFTDESLFQTFEGHGRLTAQIVANVVERARGTYGGCMLFAATVRHAEEIMASLPPANSGLVTGDDAYAMGGTVTGRDNVVRAYRAQRFKFLVSVGTLTTGFDVEHTSIIATLRRTESAALLQQILGRAWRLDPNKPRSLWLDFAENCDAHFPDGDIYKPVIQAGPPAKDKGDYVAECEWCGHGNNFTLRKEFIDGEGKLSAAADAHGYALDLAGDRVETEHGPMPVHYGRRCFNMIQQGALGEYMRCEYRWTSKECQHCGEPNDIAARYCAKCKGEMVDPNEKLAADFKAMKRDPTQRQTDRVINIDERPGVSAKGNKTIRLDVLTEWRQFSLWLMPEATFSRGMREWQAYTAVRGDVRTITYVKDADSGFYRALAWNQPADETPDGIEPKRKAPEEGQFSLIDTEDDPF